MRKKLVLGFLLIMIVSAFSLTASADNNSFYFMVQPGVNNGVAFTGANPKDDNEQAGYVYTTSSNLWDTDVYYYNIRKSPSVSGTSCSGFYRITPSNMARRVMYYNSSYAGANTNLYLEADTDKYDVYSEGNWWS